MKYSFIIPVYKVEKTLPACIDSVLSQKGDYEIILVDDCSPDNSGAICDEYAEKHDNIKVIHKENNEGLGFARNTGLSNISGDYVIFCDSDDTFTPDLLEKEDARLMPDTDILVFGVETVYLDENGAETWSEPLTAETFAACGKRAAAEAFVRLNNARIFPFAWNKIYRREFIEKNNLRFESTKLIEDFLFNIAAFSRAEKIVISPDCHYRYMRPSHETLVNSYCPEFFELCKRKHKLEYDFLASHDYLTDDALYLIRTAYVKHLVSVIIRNRSPKAGLSVKQQKNLITEMLCDEMTVRVMAEYEPQGKKMQAVALPIKKKMTDACYLLGKTADAAQNKDMKLFKKVLRK